MSEWTKRLQKVQNEMEKPELESVEHLTLADLQNEPVTFGKAHLGKTHEEVWLTAPDWTKWFLGHYHGSQNLAHRRMIKFIKLKIEQVESGGVSTPSTVPKAKAKGMAKSLAARHKSAALNNQGPVTPGETEPIQCDLIEPMPWVPEDRQHEEIQDLQNRLGSLETAMHQIIHLLSQDRLNPSTVDQFPDLSDTHEHDEAWSDVWNQ